MASRRSPGHPAPGRPSPCFRQRWKIGRKRASFRRRAGTGQPWCTSITTCSFRKSRAPHIHAHARPAQECVRGRSGRSSPGSENPRLTLGREDRFSESSDRRKPVHPGLLLEQPPYLTRFDEVHHLRRGRASDRGQLPSRRMRGLISSSWPLCDPRRRN